MADIEADQSTSPALRARGAGYSVMQKVLRVQDDAPRRGRIARLLGVSPLHPDAVDLFQGALGQLETGRQLATLDARYTVLHSLPLGDTDGNGGAAGSAADGDPGGAPGSGTDIGHLVIGPAGVFCLNSTREVTAHSESAVQWEARRASKHLSRALQRVIPVTPLLVKVGDAAAPRGRRAKGAGAKGGVPKRAGSKGMPATSASDTRVEVVPSRALARWFTTRGPVLTTAELATLAIAAEQPATWRSPGAVLQQSVPVEEFHELKSEVDAAHAQGRVALAVTILIAVCVLLVTVTEVVTSIAPYFAER